MFVSLDVCIDIIMSQAEFNRDDISKYLPDELEKTKQKLRFFENALSFSTDHIFIFDNKTRFLYINPAGAKTLGIKSSNFIGKEWSDIRLPQQILEPFDIRLNAVYTARKPIKGEIEYSIDNSTKYFEYNLNPVVNDKGEVESVIAISRDITERKQAEKTLSENDFYNRSLLRLYKTLGQATAYTDIINALGPEIRETLGYNSVHLYLMRGDYEDLLLLDVGGTAAKGLEKLIKLGPEFHTNIGGEEFLIHRIKGDPYLEEMVQSEDIYIVPDVMKHPLSNKKIAAALGHQHTLIAVWLKLAERKLGLFATGTYGDEGIKLPNKKQIDYLLTLSNHVAVAVDRVRFFVEHKEAEKELKAKEEQFVSENKKMKKELEECRRQCQ
jgi:PAS domain S-box-containing protein